MNIEKIQFAGKNLINVAYGILANIALVVIILLFYYVIVLDSKENYSYEEFHRNTTFFMVALIVVNIGSFIFIIGNLLDAGKNLKNYTEEN
jgi:hypothetical protein